MDGFFQNLLLLYLGLGLLATLLALLRRWTRPRDQPSDVWRKYPAYIAFGLLFTLAVWLPRAWHVLGPLLALIGFFCSRELNRALGLDARASSVLATAAAALVIASEFVQPVQYMQIWLLAVIVGIVVASLSQVGVAIGRSSLGIAASLALFPACLASIVWLRQTGDGDFLAMFLYICIAANDAFAQIIGQLIGRRLLAPSISPGKTVEGVLGGLALAALTGAILSAMVGRQALVGALMGAVTASAGLLGDLTASRWKRALGLKDFSQLLGAHGGALDRFDSLMFAAPLVLLLLGR